MKAYKWDVNINKYLDYTLPESASCFESDMNTIIHCANCAKPLAYGDGYTSMLIHTENGFGYCVCQKCYEHEMRQMGV